MIKKSIPGFILGFLSMGSVQGMETFEEVPPYTLFQDLIPDTGESFKIIIDQVNQGTRSTEILLKNGSTTFSSPLSC